MKFSRPKLPQIGDLPPDQSQYLLSYLKDQSKPKKRRQRQWLAQLEKKGMVR